jgi:hypothetical protein
MRDCICFGEVLWGDIKSLRFVCGVDRSLTEDAFNFYLRFLKAILITQPWTGQLVKDHKTGKRGAMFSLPKISGHYVHDLLYLSAFRYVGDEFGKSVPLLYEKLKKIHTLEGRFRAFQQVHIDCALNETSKSEINITSDNGGEDHCVFWPRKRYGGSANEPISLAHFRRNLRSNNTSSVQGHFA